MSSKPKPHVFIADTGSRTCYLIGCWAERDDPIHLPGIPTCNCEGCTTYREINGEVTDERG